MVGQRFCRGALGAAALVAAILACMLLPADGRCPVCPGQVRAQDDQKPFDKPPAGQKFVGEKVCASCHFEQDLTWRKTKHAKGFEILPEKYRENKDCLKCHTTGFGEETGFKSPTETGGLVGTSCEACHGPGSQHSEMAKKFAGKELTADQKKFVGSSIWKMQPKNICVECHLAQSHKKHPPYDKE